MIYLDNGATTKMLPQVQNVMVPFLTKSYGNASSGYPLGEEAGKAVEKAREIVSGCIGAFPEEIYFTSGGSESDNWVIKGLAGELKEKGKHIITTEIEHHAVLESTKYLEKLGYEVTYLGVDANGLVDLNELQQNIRKDTTLITIMYANNEIGTIEPIKEISKMAAKNNIFFHTDAVQVVGHIPICVRDLQVDYMSASGHKFHGPKGVGFLYVRKGNVIPSYIHGGGQEMGKRAGTENVAGIVGMAEALKIMTKEIKANCNKVTELRNYFIYRIRNEIEDVLVNGHESKRLPGNVNISIKGVEATELLILLQEKGVFASSASACSKESGIQSHVIRAIKVPNGYSRGTIRFTIGEENTKSQIDKTMALLKKYVQFIRMG